MKNLSNLASKLKNSYDNRKNKTSSTPVSEKISDLTLAINKMPDRFSNSLKSSLKGFAFSLPLVSIATASLVGASDTIKSTFSKMSNKKDKDNIDKSEEKTKKDNTDFYNILIHLNDEMLHALDSIDIGMKSLVDLTRNVWDVSTLQFDIMERSFVKQKMDEKANRKNQSISRVLSQQEKLKQDSDKQSEKNGSGLFDKTKTNVLGFGKMGIAAVGAAVELALPMVLGVAAIGLLADTLIEFSKSGSILMSSAKALAKTSEAVAGLVIDAGGELLGDSFFKFFEWSDQFDQWIRENSGQGQKIFNKVSIWANQIVDDIVKSADDWVTGLVASMSLGFKKIGDMFINAIKSMGRSIIPDNTFTRSVLPKSTMEFLYPSKSEIEATPGTSQTSLDTSNAFVASNQATLNRYIPLTPKSDLSQTRSIITNQNQLEKVATQRDVNQALGQQTSAPTIINTTNNMGSNQKSAVTSIGLRTRNPEQNIFASQIVTAGF